MVFVRVRPLLLLAALAAIAFPQPLLPAAAAESPTTGKLLASPSSSYGTRAAGVPKQLLHRHPTPGRRSAAPAVTQRAQAETPRTPAVAAVGGAWSFIGPKPVVNATSCCTNTSPPKPYAVYGNVGGRVTSLVTDPTNAAVVYAGTAGGGVWKTTNSGSTWTPLGDTQASTAIGALAIDPTGQVIYAGTGEDNLSDSQPGQGILKSTDGGVTWSLIGQAVFAGDHIGSIAIDRTTSGSTQRVLVASDDGLYVSVNGGASWTKNTSYVSLLSRIGTGTTPSGAVTLVIQDPSISGKFWLSASDFCRTEGGDILSGDGASSWALTEPKAGPFFTTVSSRIGLAIGAGGTGAAVWLAAAACSGNLLDVQHSSDGGASWIDAPPSTPGLTNYFNLGAGGQGDYDNVVAVDPGNPGSVVLGGVTVLATSDGGAHFQDIGDVYGETHLNGVMHPDFHAVAFTSADHFYIGNDGGVWSTADLGGARNATPGSASDWANLNATLAAIQFWQGSAIDSAHLLGGTQDNGSVGHFPGAAAQPAMQDYSGGDGSYTAIDPTPGSTTIYSEYPFAEIVRNSTVLTPNDPASPFNSVQEAGPCRQVSTPSDPACADAADFDAPFQMDQGNPQRLVAATNKVYLSTNGGGAGGPASWTLISPDLSTGTVDLFYGDSIHTLVMGPRAVTNIVLAGSAAGNVYRSVNATDAAATWTKINGNLPAFPGATSPNFVGPWVSGLTFNPANPSEAWATIGGLGVGHVWHTSNAGDQAGTSWTNIDGSGVSAVGNVRVNAIVIDPASPSNVYVATNFGVLVCQTCGGAGLAPAWVPLGSGLPNVQVLALSFSRDNQTLFAWTHGRGVWDLPTVAAHAPLLVVSPKSMTFSQAQGGAAPGPQTLTVANDGNAPLAWTATPSTTSGGNWLGASPGTGTTAADDQSAVTVTVNATGLSPGTYNGSIAVTSNGGTASVPVTLNVGPPVATATLHFPALMNSAYGNPGYTTTIYLENTSGSALAAGAVTIVYFDLNGNVVGKGDSSPALASGAVWAVSQNNGNGFLPGGAGSAAVYSSASLVGFANQEWPGADGSSYTAIPHPNAAATVYAPAVMNYAFGGYTTGMGITNAGTGTTTVTVTYHDQAGSAAGTRTRSLAPNAYWGLYQGEAGTPLPQGFAGTAVLTTNPPQPLAMVVNEVNGNPSSTANGQFLTYVGTGSGATTLYAPVAFNNAYGGYATGMGIENIGASPASVTITYSGQVGSAPASQTYTETFTVPAGGYVGDYNGRTDASNPLPDQFHGSATITSTQPLVEIVNEIQSGQVPGTSYNTFASGTTVVRLPLVENNLNGFSTGLAVENVGSGTATVTITYADPSTGNQVGTSSASPLTLAPGQFAGIYQGPGGDGGVPSGTRATAILSASGTGAQLAVIVNQRSNSSFMSYTSQVVGGP